MGFRMVLQLKGGGHDSDSVIAEPTHSLPKVRLKMIFLFPRWDMLVSKNLPFA